MKKVLLLSDGQGWIMDRIALEYKKYMPFEFTIQNYRAVNNYMLLQASSRFDLIHYINWDVAHLIEAIKEIKTPQLLSIRSLRYPESTYEVAKYCKVNVNNRDLLEKFPDSIFIPDGNMTPLKKEFKVGMAFQDTEYNREYKGYNLVKKVCDDLKIDLELSSNRTPEETLDWYKTKDLIVIASLNEGYNTIACECMAQNIPFVTTNVGLPKLLNCHKMERSYAGIKEAIERFYTAPQLEGYSMENICKLMTNLYNSLCQN